MKNEELKRLAQLSNASPAAVSKTMNHCHGVSAELRHRILSTAEKEGLVQDAAVRVDIYMILPDTPVYFWGQLYRSMQHCKFSCKQNIYSALYDDPAVLLSYLREARSLSARVIILAATQNTEVQKELSQFPPETMILFLCEYWEYTNAFYVGSNPKADGALLARETEKYPEVKRLLVLNYEESATVRARIAGYCETLRKDIAVSFCNYPNGGRNFSSLLARELYVKFQEQSYDAVMCPDGIIPEVMQAIAKLKLITMPLLFGFDMSELSFGEYSGAVLCQNITGQGELAIRLAEHYIETGCYPSQKKNYVSSVFYQIGSKA